MSISLLAGKYRRWFVSLDLAPNRSLHGNKNIWALLASSIIRFILTVIVFISRIAKKEKEASMFLVDSGVGLCMAVFNIVIGALALYESIAINKNLELVSTSLDIHLELYITAAVIDLFIAYNL